MNFRVDINICRICMKNGTKMDCMLNDVPVLRKFVSVTQLKVTKSDGLPTLICEKCALRLKIASEFRETALNTDKHLRLFLQKVNREFQETTKTSPGRKGAPVSEPDADEDLQMLLEEEQENECDSKEMQSGSIKMDHFDEVAKSPLGSVLMPKVEEEIVEEVEGIEIYHELAEMEGEHMEEIEEEVEEIQYIDENCELQLYDENSNDFGSEVVSIINHSTEEEQSTSTKVEFTEVKAEKTKRQYTRRSTTTTPETIVSNNGKTYFYCSKCKKDFSTKTNLMRHMATHDGSKPYQCNVCGNSFTQNGSLKQHMLIHTGEKPHTCRVCGRGFTQSKSLTFHMRRHTGEKPYECDICNVHFRQKDGLKRHNAVKHSNNPSEEFPCNICNRVMHSKYSLRVHLRKHFAGNKEEKDQSFDCNQCYKSFLNQSTLDTHKLVHNGDGLFKCTHCDKQFTRKSSLVAHVRVHEDETVLSCFLCKKIFESGEELNDHLQECNENESGSN